MSIKVEKVSVQTHFGVIIENAELTVVHYYDYNTDSDEWTVEYITGSPVDDEELEAVKKQAMEAVKKYCL